MKWFASLLLLLGSLYGKPLDLNVSAEGVILVNARTGAVLFEKNAHVSAFPASTTKIATALYAIEKVGNQLDKPFKATQDCIASITPQAKKQSNYRSPSHWLETDGVHIGIKNGEEFRFYDLLCATLIGSANDAANVIAKGLGGSIPTFMEELNRYLKSLGCEETFFNNPHGLHHPQHFTTPYDLSVMARKGLKNPLFRQIVSMSRHECPQTNLEYERTFLQTNLLLRNGAYAYPQAIGIKTGTTQAAGKNLVAAAEENGRCIIGVFLGGRAGRDQLYREAIEAFDTAFSEQKMRRYLLKKGAANLTTKVVGARRKLQTVLPDGLFYDFYPSEECPVKAKVSWEIPSLPIQQGGRVGTIRVVDERGSLVQETALCAAEPLKPTLWYRATHLLTGNKRAKQGIFLGGVAFIALFFWRLRAKRAPRRPLF